MLFCEKCGSLKVPSKKDGKRVMKCSSCGLIDKDTKSAKISEKVQEIKDLPIIEKEIETNAITDVDCRKCGHKKAYYWFVQTRCSDEPATQFFKCVKCNNVWKEY